MARKFSQRADRVLDESPVLLSVVMRRSPQQTLPSREEFEERIARYEKEFDGRAVPRPPHWGGYLVTPDMIEFWYAAKFRLHERVRYEWFDGEWTKRELYP